MSDMPVEIGTEADVDPLDAIEPELSRYAEAPDDDITVKRSQVQKWNNELKTYRQKWGETRRTWEGVPDEDVKAMNTFYRALASGDPGTIQAAATWVNELISELSPAEKKAVQEAVKEEAAETGKTQAQVKAELTPEDIERMVAEKLEAKLTERQQAERQEAAVQAALQDMNKVAADLGDQYGIPAWATPGSDFYGTLLTATNRVIAQKGLSVTEAMKEAAAELAEQFQSVSVAAASRKKATAGAGAKAAPKGGAEPPSGQGTPKSFDDAQAKARQRLMAHFDG